MADVPPSARAPASGGQTAADAHALRLDPPGPRHARVGLLGAVVFLAVAIGVFTDGWSHGKLTIDGPGVSLWLRLLLRHWHAGHGVPAWLPDMWAGTPAWGLVPAFHLLVLLPIAGVWGPDAAVKLGVVGAQIVGAWGAFVLARSLWSRGWPAFAAGLFYGLHPFFPSAGALLGHEPYVWVFAATPWLAWALRRGLRREGTRYVVLSGLIVGFALVEQAELAYSLVLLCGLLVAVELARAWHAGGAAGGRAVLLRAGAVVAIGLGTAAHWLVPFLTMSKSFVLTPAEDVNTGRELLSGALGREPGALLHRATELAGTYDFPTLVRESVAMKGALASGFYLSWVCLALTLVSIVWLALRRRDDGTLSAILLASAVGIWMSMGTVPLASGGLARQSHVLTLIVVGAVIGMLVGSFLRRLDLRRAAVPTKIGAVLLLLAFPFVTPISLAGRLLPFLGSIRFPRLYPLAALGVALGAAYPLSLIHGWAATRWPRMGRHLCAGACLVVAGAFLVDVHPYRSFYRLRPPDGTVAYGQASQIVSASSRDFRLAVDYPDNPQPVTALLGTGRGLSVGWPHPTASKNLWRLTMEAFAGPSGYRDAAFGLSSTFYLATERLTDDGHAVQELPVQPNPKVLPLVRAYEQVVVGDESIAPELAVSLAGRYIGVVTGREGEAQALGGTATRVIGAPGSCVPGPDNGDTPLAGDVAMACALHNWIGVRSGNSTVTTGGDAGAEFVSTVDGLRGVTVWLDRAPGPTELVLHEVAADGLSIRREVRRTQASDIDANGMARFSFDRIPESAGHHYLFLLSCARCAPEERPQIVVSGEPRGRGALVAGDHLDPRRAADFSPVYDQLPPAPPPAAELRANRAGPGTWRIDVSGARPCLVVVAESYFPGWKARVDGKPAKVMEADGAFLGVAVGAGRHEVTLEYHRSAAFPIGLAVTVSTLLLSTVVLLAPGGGRFASPFARSRPRSGIRSAPKS